MDVTSGHMQVPHQAAFHWVQTDGAQWMEPYYVYQPRRRRAMHLGHPDPGLCMYPSKACHHPRATQRNGTLHRLCEYHRQRANLNQQRWAKRNKWTLEEFELGISAIDSNPAVNWMVDASIDLEHVDPMDLSELLPDGADDLDLSFLDGSALFDSDAPLVVDSDSD